MAKAHAHMLSDRQHTAIIEGDTLVRHSRKTFDDRYGIVLTAGDAPSEPRANLRHHSGCYAEGRRSDSVPGMCDARLSHRTRAP